MIKIIQTYQQGLRHKSTGQACEDRTAFLNQNGVCTIALADGAGSQKYTHAALGAECVCKTVCRLLCDNFEDAYLQSDELLCNTIADTCQSALHTVMEDNRLDSIERLSSTLLCVAIKGNRVIVVHIGDGVIGCLTESGTKVLSPPQNGEFAGTTYFIAMPQAMEYIRISKMQSYGMYAVFMMSDGTADYCYDESAKCFTNGAAKLALLAFAEGGQSKLKQIVSDVLVQKDSLSDDCSFIAMALGEKPPQGIDKRFELLKTKSESASDNCVKEPSALSLTAMPGNIDDKPNKRENERIIGIGRKNKKLKTAVIILSVLSILFATILTGESILLYRKTKQLEQLSVSISQSESKEQQKTNKKNASKETSGESILSEEQTSLKDSSQEESAQQDDKRAEKYDNSKKQEKGQKKREAADQNKTDNKNTTQLTPTTPVEEKITNSE